MVRVNRQRVLLIGHHTPIIHGQSIQYTQLIEGAKKWEGIEVLSVNTVYSQTREGLSGFSIKKSLLLVSYLFQVFWVLFFKRPDVIVLSPAFHAGSFLKDSLFVLLSKIVSSAQVVAWVHMDPSRIGYELRSRWFQKYVSWVVGKFDIFVGCAPLLLGRWPSFLNTVPKKFIFNGVEDLTLGWKRVNNTEGQKTVNIGYLSAMDTQKGWRELLSVAEKLCKKYPFLNFHFYGGIGAGENESDVNIQFKNHRNPSQVKWYGETWGKEKEKAFKEMDLYCFPSHTEAFPLSVLEAMSFSLPIVTTDVGAVRDAVVEGMGGWYCQANNEDSLLEALEKSLNERSSWSQMGKFNREQYENKFSSAAFLTNWYMFLKEIGELSGGDAEAFRQKTADGRGGKSTL